jgi:hypothetical protein
VVSLFVVMIGTGVANPEVSGSYCPRRSPAPSRTSPIESRGSTIGDDSLLGAFVDHPRDPSIDRRAEHAVVAVDPA